MGRAGTEEGGIAQPFNPATAAAAARVAAHCRAPPGGLVFAARTWWYRWAQSTPHPEAAANNWRGIGTRETYHMTLGQSAISACIYSHTWSTCSQAARHDSAAYSTEFLPTWWWEQLCESWGIPDIPQPTGGWGLLYLFSTTLSSQPTQPILLAEPTAQSEKWGKSGNVMYGNPHDIMTSARLPVEKRGSTSTSRGAAAGWSRICS